MFYVRDLIWWVHIQLDNNENTTFLTMAYQQIRTNKTHALFTF